MAISKQAKATPQKNLCNKTVKASNAYEVWRVDEHPVFGGQWTWFVLKKYQGEVAEASNPHARWFTLVDGYELEAGDTFVSDIKGAGARKLEGQELSSALGWAKINSKYV